MIVYRNAITTYWNYLFYELPDPRNQHYFLIKDPAPLIIILYVYHKFVTKWGQEFMKDRKPFELKNTLIVYNLFQVLMSLYMFVNSVMIWADYNWQCEPVDYSDTPRARFVAWGVYFFYIAKLTELLDTVFFVLRKNNRQITFLHLYHHTSIPLLGWFAAKYYPGGHFIFIGYLNSFVHVVMYSYYLIAALGPKYRKYLWWKKYITIIQIIQFLFLGIHSSQALFYDCGAPQWVGFIAVPSSIVFFNMFSSFYRKTYNKKEVADDQKNK